MRQILYKKTKLFTLQLAVITSVLLYFSLSISRVMGLPRSQSRCIVPIGRIMSTGDRYLPSGSLLCPTDQISSKQGNQVKVLCYSSGKYLSVEPGKNFYVQEICKPPEMSSVRKCTLFSLQDCPNRKGPNEQENAPNIIQPYGKVLINRRPLVSWKAVDGATSYVVRIDSGNRHWRTEVNATTTTLPYPQDNPELPYGSVNKIIVIAKKDIHPISDNTLVVYVLPQQWVTQINQTIQQVLNLRLSPDETAYLDLDAIYMSNGLLNQTIETLEAQVRAGSFNPTLYRILGDHYVEAWMPQKAKTAYAKALQLAKFRKNSDEVGLVQERLSALTQSQLPTRTNPAQ